MRRPLFQALDAAFHAEAVVIDQKKTGVRRAIHRHAGRRHEIDHVIGVKLQPVIQQPIVQQFTLQIDQLFGFLNGDVGARCQHGLNSL